jgi:hypothetical protein
VNDLNSIKELFYKRCYKLDYDSIVEMSEFHDSTELNNVIVGLNKECFGLIATTELDYKLFYVSGKELKGDLIELNIEEEFRDDLVFLFSQYLSTKYTNLEPVSVFNNFQNYTRSFLERNNRLSISSTELEKFKDYNFEIIAPGMKGINVIPIINKVDFYRQYFGYSDDIELSTQHDYVYLMLNSRTNLIKIGRSIKPAFRERTLQSQEPEIVLIAKWKAPKEIERQLHDTFRQNRKRGEWFELKFGELRQLKEFMKAYA